MDCHHATRLIDGMLDGTLTAPERDALDRHALECLSCRSRIDRLEFVMSAVSDSLGSQTLPETATAAILAATGKERRCAPLRLHSVSMHVAAAALALIAGIFGFVVGRRAVPADGTLTTPQLGIKVSEAVGLTLYRHAEAATWRALGSDSTFCIGDELVSAPGGRAVLRMGDYGLVTLSASSRLAIRECDGTTRIELLHGTLAATLDSPHPPFEVTTPNGLVRALGTDFEVTVR